jgi:hypothetical protein
MRVSFPHSHAFQGGRLLIEKAEMSEAMCVVEFGDTVCRLDGPRESELAGDVGSGVVCRLSSGIHWNSFLNTRAPLGG